MEAGGDQQAATDLPAVPTLGVERPKGALTPRYLRLAGQTHLGSQVTVSGFVVWIYDCAAALAAEDPDASAAKIRKLVADSPEKCSRPHFYLGDTPDAIPRRSIWVVEVPRLLRPDEKKHMTRREIAAHPTPPKLTLGAKIVVKGTWAVKSPKGFANSRGLLVFDSVLPPSP